MPTRTHDGIKKRCECGQRHWAKCSHPWHFSFHHGGVEHRHSLDVVARARGLPPPTSKSEAASWRDRLRSEIRGGTFVDPAPTPTPTPAADARLTFGDVVTDYRDRYVNVPTRRPTAIAMFNVHLNMLLRATVPAPHGTTIALREKAIDAITKADVEAIRSSRRAELAAARAAQLSGTKDAHTKHVRRPGVKDGEVGINRLLARLRHVFAWAIAEWYATDTPFKRYGVTVVKLKHRAETPRDRQLHPGEEARLLEHAGPHPRGLIVATLTTGCREGELLSLRWGHVRRDDQGVARGLGWRRRGRKPTWRG